MKTLFLVLLLTGTGLFVSAQDDLRYKDSIRVVVSFTVDESGQPGDIKVVRMNCNCPKKMKDSITRNVKEIILRNPFPIKKDNNGKPIKAQYLQPIVFKLEDEE